MPRLLDIHFLSVLDFISVFLGMKAKKVCGGERAELAGGNGTLGWVTNYLPFGSLGGGSARNLGMFLKKWELPQGSGSELVNGRADGDPFHVRC